MRQAPLTGRVAVVTGAGRGIGAATARRLGADGARLVLNDLDAAALETTCSVLRADDVALVPVVGSLTDRSTAQAVVDAALGAFGTLDIVVNNAGSTNDRMFHNLTDADLDLALGANVRTAWNMTQAALSVMRPAAKAEIESAGSPGHHRKIIFTASVAALTGNPGQANYTAAKGALIALVKTLALELGPLGINVNAVAPGFIETRLTATKTEGASLGIPEEVRASIREMIALGRFGVPADVANATAFLASPDSDFVSGVTLPVTGGQFGGMG
jgi:3-oxoacyl-[acyl-carrier protein] reductase